MKSVTNFFLGLLVGALVGAILGLLFAPSSGDELRNDLQKRADQIASDVRTAIEEERERLETELEALRKGEIKVA